MKYELVILDRDGVINFPAPDGEYVFTKKSFVLYDDVKIFIKELLNHKIKVAIASNQRGIALNIYSREDVESLHQIFLNACGLGDADVRLFYCPHNIDECECRKPKPGLLIESLTTLNVKASRAVFIGDKESDGDAARALAIDFMKLTRGIHSPKKNEFDSLTACLPDLLGNYDVK